MKKINKELLKNLVVLYVEDEINIAEEVEFFLKQFISNVHVAYNGEEGLELYKKFQPDIIITDIQMPKLNGLDMIRQLGKKRPPIIITTAHSDVEFFLDAIELKVEQFIIKPIDLEVVIDKVQSLIADTLIKDTLFEKDSLLKIVDENVLLSITDKNGNIIEASHAYCEFIGYSKDKVIGQSHQFLRHEDTADSFYENMWKIISSGKVFKSEVKNKNAKGETFWTYLTITPVYHGEEIVNFTAIRQDITSKKILEDMAIHDELTSLYNRRYYNEVIEREIKRVKREEKSFALLSLDIDYFKRYNDSYGHPQGDVVLQKISSVLKEHFSRSSDYVFRMGGEEFAVIISDTEQSKIISHAQLILEKIEALKIIHENSKVHEYVTVSAGLAIFGHDKIPNSEMVYKYSDEALYTAKSKGRNQMIIYDLEH